MANQAEPGTMGGAASDAATAQNVVAASQSAPAAQSGTAGYSRAAASRVAGHSGPYPPFHGRTVSWVAVSIVMVGFLAGGLALMLGHHGPLWWLFWAGAGLAVLGLLVSVATNTFEDWY